MNSKETVEQPLEALSIPLSSNSCAFSDISINGFCFCLFDHFICQMIYSMSALMLSWSLSLTSFIPHYKREELYRFEGQWAKDLLRLSQQLFYTLLGQCTKANDKRVNCKKVSDLKGFNELTICCGQHKLDQSFTDTHKSFAHLLKPKFISIGLKLS